MSTYVVRWQSAAGSKPNEITPVVGPAGDLILPPDVFEELVLGTSDLVCNDDDGVAEAVISATMHNVDVERTRREEEALRAADQPSPPPNP